MCDIVVGEVEGRELCQPRERIVLDLGEAVVGEIETVGRRHHEKLSFYATNTSVRDRERLESSPSNLADVEGLEGRVSYVNVRNVGWKVWNEEGERERHGKLEVSRVEPNEGNNSHWHKRDRTRNCDCRRCNKEPRSRPGYCGTRGSFCRGSCRPSPEKDTAKLPRKNIVPGASKSWRLCSIPTTDPPRSGRSRPPRTDTSSPPATASAKPTKRRKHKHLHDFSENI